MRVGMIGLENGIASEIRAVYGGRLLSLLLMVTDALAGKVTA